MRAWWLPLTLVLPTSIANAAWEHLGLEGYVVRSMASNGEHLFVTTRAASEPAAVWRFDLQSPDVEWERVWSVVGQKPMQVAVHPTSPDSVFLVLIPESGAADSAAVYRSTDGGETWWEADDGFCGPPGDAPGAYLIDIPAAVPPVIFVLSDNVPMRSFDAGSTWLPTESPFGCEYCGIPGCFGGLDLAIGADDPDVLWITQVDSFMDGHVVRSEDGGLNWELVEHVNQGSRRIAIDPRDARRVYKWSPLVRSEDGGDTWIDITPPTGTARLVLDAQNPDILYSATGVLTYYSSDRGRSWHPVDGQGLPGGDLIAAFAADPLEMGTLYTAFREGGVYRGEAEIVGVEGTWSIAARDRITFRVPAVTTSNRTDVQIELPEPMTLRLSIFDVAGRWRDDLFIGMLSAGGHMLPVVLRQAAGIYFLRLEAHQEVQTKKLVFAP